MSGSVDSSEQPVVFDCAGERLVGVVGAPQQPAPIGVVIVVGGPQVRAGSHRQFVQLARACSTSGHAVLRFDVRGMGDSSGALRGFEDCSADIAAAIGALQAAQPAVRRVVLWGLCDGASAALLYLHEHTDARVAGLALLNPWVRSDASLAKTHVKHYYLQRLRQPSFWRKLLSGRVAFAAAAGLARNLRAAFGSADPPGAATLPFQDRMAAAWAAFTGPVLLMLSADDLTAREFSEFTAAAAAWQQALRARPPTRLTLQRADHTCSHPDAQRAVEAATAHWLAGVAA